MPPPQCPECGRFLATAFVQQITVAAAPCPRCGTALYLGEDDEPDDDESTAGPDVTITLDEPAVAAADDASVRPIDLADNGTSRDPLAGWDVGPVQVPTTGADVDPTALAVGAGAGLAVGLLLGGRDHRGLGAVLGAVLGALLARLRG